MQVTTFSMKAISNWVYIKERRKNKKKTKDNSVRKQEIAALAAFQEQNIGSVISNSSLPGIFYV